MLKALAKLSCFAIFMVVALSACSKSNMTAEDVQEALRQQGIEVNVIQDSIPELDKGTSLQLDGLHPEAFELTLPAADMAHREFLLVYAFHSEQERQSAGQPDKISSLQLQGLNANVHQTKNVIVIYWSHSEENPLMLEQFAGAMNGL